MRLFNSLDVLNRIETVHLLKLFIIGPELEMNIDSVSFSSLISTVQNERYPSGSYAN